MCQETAQACDISVQAALETRPARFLTAEILAVGTEILLGNITNSNAAFLSRELANLGVAVYTHTAVGDNHARLAAALRLSERPDEAMKLYVDLLSRLDNQDARKEHQALYTDILFRLGHLYLTAPRERERNKSGAVQHFREFLTINDGRLPRDRHPQYDMVKDYVRQYDELGGR